MIETLPAFVDHGAPTGTGYVEVPPADMQIGPLERVDLHDTERLEHLNEQITTTIELPGRTVRVTTRRMGSARLVVSPDVWRTLLAEWRPDCRL